MLSTPKSGVNLLKHLFTVMLSITIFSVVASATITLTSCSSSEATAIENPETTPDDSPEEEGTPAVDPVANTTRVGSWVHWYNADLQGGDGSDDYDFGPNPYLPGKSEEYYDAKFRERVKKDTALAAADMAWLDACVGTRYLGVFYEEAQRNWATTMNDAKLKFAGDQDTFYSSVDAFFRYLNAAKKVEIRECHGVTDQMYMNPFTPDGIPDIIVVSSDDQSGHELVYTFEIKGQLFEVAYRIDCGFQPKNVSERMGITPESEFPSAPEEPGKGGNTPQPEPGPQPQPEPGPQPQPEPEYVKDTTQGTVSDPGEGRSPYTNNGDGAQTSSAAVEEQPTSYEEYEERVKETESQVGDSSSTTPSTEAPEDTTVFNDGAEAANDPATDSSFDRPADGSELNADPDAEWSIQE